MSQIPNDLKYTKTHEWVRVEQDGTVTIGITDHAQEALGDLVFVELPEAGRTLAQDEVCAVVESVKAASDIYAPVAGTVVEANSAVVDAPESVNQNAYGAWLFKMKQVDATSLENLLDADAYAQESD